MSQAKYLLVIHYSCESFYERPLGSSPRITSIAVRHFESGQTASFSIHQVAEKEGILDPNEISQRYDEFEKRMLREFYDYIDRHLTFVWGHWNMRDINYGFAALEHRARVVGTKPIEIPEERRIDLARLLPDLYGLAYIGHPRLEKLVAKNDISTQHFLTGKAEAEAFEAKQYVKLHQSTLRKVDIIANILGRTANGSLKTDACWMDIYGSYPGAILGLATEHWIVALLGLLASVVSIIGFVLSING